MSVIKLRPKFLGCVVGLACGDALGYPTEFMSLGSIYERYGPDGIRDLSQARMSGREALFTDDTQMTVAVMQGLIRAGRGATCDSSAPFVAEEFVSWSIAPPGGHRAPGGACMSGCYALRNAPSFDDWERTGGPTAGGCGSVMRSAPYGLFFQNLDDAIECAARHSCMTHRDPLARAASAALAAGVWHAVRDRSKDDILESMVHAAAQYDAKTARMIHEDWVLARSVTNQPALRQALSVVLDRRRGWAGHEAIAGSAFCFYVAPDYVTAVRYAVNSPGDSDSLGCIAGALAGALWGMGGERGVPPEWDAIIERREKLHMLARTLHVASCDADALYVLERA